jgi:uncharacterized membrane protein
MRFSPILLLHIYSGTIGLLSGAIALAFRKGSNRHAMAGQVFVVAMICLGASAMYLAVRKNQTGNFFGGMMAIYLATTAWLTMKRRNGETARFDWAMILAPLAIGVSSLIGGMQRLLNPTAFHDGVPAGMPFFIATVMLLAIGGDVRMLLRGLTPTQRLVRHLWRMCFGLFIASGSIFIARPHLFPEFMRRAGMLVVLGVLPLLLMIFWLVRIRLSPGTRRKEGALTTGRQPLLSAR